VGFDVGFDFSSKDAYEGGNDRRRTVGRSNEREAEERFRVQWLPK
jgi:hypothetical protein